MNAEARKILGRLLFTFPAAAVLVCGILDLPGRQVLRAAGLAAIAAYFLGMFIIVVRDMVRAESAHRSAQRQKQRLCVKCGYDLRASVSRCPECGTPVVAPKLPEAPRTPMLARVDARARELAHELQCDYVGSEHLLLALFDESAGTAAQALDNLGITADDVRQELTEMGIAAPVPFAQVVTTDSATSVK